MIFVRPVIAIGRLLLFRVRFVEQMREPSQRQRVSLRSESGDHAVGALRNKGMVAEFLALVDVRDMHLDNDAGEAIERVEDRDRRMGERSGVDQNSGIILAPMSKPVTDFILGALVT